MTNDVEKIPTLLAPLIRAAAADIDAGSDLPARLRTELREAGAFRMLTPKNLGGAEAPLTTTMTVYEQLGRLDASVAWVVWNANFGFIGAMMEEAGTARIWGESEPVFANSGMPGVAVPVEDGYRVSGSWRLVSGVNGADWVIVIAGVVEDGSPRLTEAGTPDVRLFPVRRDQITIKNTWNVNGLRGSGSDDIVVDGAVVAEALVVRLDRPAVIDRPLYRGFIPALVIPGCTAVVVGLAQTAIDETVKLATVKTGMSGSRLAELAHTQSVVARSQSALDAARLLLFDTIANVDSSLRRRAAMRSAMSHAAQVVREVLVAMYELSSSSSLYIGNPIERLFRDGMVTLQHANHSATLFDAAGRVRFGLDPGVSLF
ncbi:acyl-CoA dehydrogenase [Actinoplanes sp. TBRC 11911]|uniref:acyl-CoA dehydrogenase family protein n=1 Tax=Actinoplanes sp. TBRC 11911 TaxID=2729386 RepID=UPI00145D7190|nr:acyl-CoA dehydrogenase family protein [Actinoplanes sp. TBRC 11911]NMO55408.1 acyl-CoA dehydrogenase [Actinoplanes sp. TBRC 11911]